MRNPWHLAWRSPFRSPARRKAAAAALLGASASIVSAGTSSTYFNVSTTVLDRCTVSSSGLSFGSYDPTNAAGLRAQGTISAKCTKGDAVSVALNQGANPAPGSTPVAPIRRMTDGASHYVPYHIYIAAPPSRAEWGTGAAGKSQPPAQIAAGAGAPVVFTAYGALSGGTNVPAGEYTDVIMAVVTF
jgi:spore coat protein U-like protein